MMLWPGEFLSRWCWAGGGYGWMILTKRDGSVPPQPCVALTACPGLSLQFALGISSVWQRGGWQGGVIRTPAPSDPSFQASRPEAGSTAGIGFSAASAHPTDPQENQQVPTCFLCFSLKSSLTKSHRCQRHFCDPV